MGWRDFTCVVATRLWPVDLCATIPTRQTAHRAVATALGQLDGESHSGVSAPQASSGSGPSESEGDSAGRGARRWKIGIRKLFHR